MKKYKTVLADPPWQFNDSLDDRRKKPYETMNVKDLCNLQINDLTEKESHLYLWVASAFLKESFEVIESWGFDYKCHIPWLKRTKNGKIWFGMGHYFRHCNELCLFATKGNLRLKNKNTRNFLDAKKPGRHHAAKPDEMYVLIEACSYPNFLELFATQPRDNWDSYGYEINGIDIRNKIKTKGELKRQRQTTL